MISAYDVGHVSSSDSGQRYSFGIDSAKTSKELRKLADAIDVGRVLVNSVMAVGRATAQDFTETRVVLRLVEKMPPEKVLIGNDGEVVP
jgi:hypothetical protein